MKLVVQVKLAPSPEQAAALEATLHACNGEADRISDLAYWSGRKTRTDLQPAAYAGLKAAGLSAQPALHVIRKVADAYSTLAANLRAGNYGKPGSPRRMKVESKPISFRADAAQPYDDRCLSWQHDAATLSIWTVRGRLKNIAFTGSPDHLMTLREYRRGETDLVRRDGKFFLIATCEIPAAPLGTEPDGQVGVDVGIENIATLSTSTEPKAGKDLGRYRRRMLAVRAELQATGTKSAKQKLWAACPARAAARHQRQPCDLEEHRGRG